MACLRCRMKAVVPAAHGAVELIHPLEQKKPDPIARLDTFIEGEYRNFPVRICMMCGTLYMPPSPDEMLPLPNEKTERSEQAAPRAKTEWDTINECLVSVTNDAVTIMRPPLKMSKRRAVMFAAWIVALADDDGEFEEALKAVLNC